MPPDPTDPVASTAAIDASVAALERQSEASAKATETFGLFSSMSKTVENVLGSLNSKLVAAGIDLRNLGDPAVEVSSKFGLLATAVVGATESFKGLSGIDTGSLSTFSSQLKDVMDILNGPGTLGGEAKAKAIDAIKTSLQALGRPAIEIEKAIESGTKAFSAYAENVLKSADNGLRLQNSYLQLSASTGNFGDVMRNAGDDLSGMNALLAKQSEMLAKAGVDTKLSADQLQQYWAQLGSIPDVLDKMTFSLNKGDESINILTASVQLAQGSGRQYKDVIQDLRTAMIDYGLSTTEAFNFTARIGEISQKFKAPMEDVRKALLGSADAFKTFADAGMSSARQSEGFATIMNQYTDALKSTGLSAHNAVSLVSQMTNAVSGLRIEQKAFLSQQTGGPGGLMGGFQIEQMLRAGKIDEVFDKVREQMQKQFGGKIVNLNEAASSPAAANQLEKQIQILQKGPLGGFAKTDEDAIRILEAFRARQEGTRGVQGLSQSAAADQVAKGAQIQNLSNTPLSSLRSTLESIRYNVNIANLSTAQKVMTAAAGTPLADTETRDQKDMRANLQITTPTDTNATVGTMAGQNIAKLQELFQQLPKTSQAVLQGMGQAIASGKQENVNEQRSKLTQDIQADRDSKDSQIKQQFLRQTENVLKTTPQVKPATIVSPPVENKNIPTTGTVPPVGSRNWLDQYMFSNPDKAAIAPKTNTSSENVSTKTNIPVSTTTPESTEALDQVNKQINLQKQTTDKLINYKPPTLSSLDKENFGKPVETNSGDIVAAAARTSAATTNQPTTGTTPTDNVEVNRAPGTSSGELNFKVNVDAICSVCKHNLEASEQSLAINPALRQ